MKKTNGHTWKSPYSAPCPRLFLATLRSSVLSFLLQFNPSLSLKTLRENSFLSSHNVVLPPLNSAPLPLLFLLFFFGFAFPTISATATFFATFSPAATFSSGATFSSATTFFVQSFCSRLMACRTPLQKVPPRVKVLLQLQKSEVDSL